MSENIMYISKITWSQKQDPNFTKSDVTESTSWRNGALMKNLRNVMNERYVQFKRNGGRTVIGSRNRDRDMNPSEVHAGHVAHIEIRVVLDVYGARDLHIEVLLPWY
jgi:hypothetical protein